jgi:hypothetical protein
MHVRVFSPTPERFLLSKVYRRRRRVPRNGLLNGTALFLAITQQQRVMQTGEVEAY